MLAIDGSKSAGEGPRSIDARPSVQIGGRAEMLFGASVLQCTSVPRGAERALERATRSHLDVLLVRGDRRGASAPQCPPVISD